MSGVWRTLPSSRRQRSSRRPPYHGVVERFSATLPRPAVPRRTSGSGAMPDELRSVGVRVAVWWTILMPGSLCLYEPRGPGRSLWARCILTIRSGDWTTTPTSTGPSGSPAPGRRPPAARLVAEARTCDPFAGRISARRQCCRRWNPCVGPSQRRSGCPGPSGDRVAISRWRRRRGASPAHPAESRRTAETRTEPRCRPARRPSRRCWRDGRHGAAPRHVRSSKSRTICYPQVRPPGTCVHRSRAPRSLTLL